VRRNHSSISSWAGIVLVLTLAASCPGAVTFEKTYGGDSLDQGFCVRQTMDGGYIVSGRTKSFGEGRSDVYLLKTDSLGNPLWSRAFGGPLDDEGFCVRETVDRGYVISGYTESSGEGCEDAYLIKTDSLGDTLWTRTYGGYAGEWAYAVRQTPDTGYIVVGATWTFGGGGGRALWLIKTDSIGDTLWWRTHGSGLDRHGYDVELTRDGCYIMAGTSYRAFLVKANPEGYGLFGRSFLVGSAYAVRQTSDSGYIVAGGRYPYMIDLLDLCLVKTNPIGNPEWIRFYGDTLYSTEEARAVELTGDGAYIVAGYNRGDAWLLKVDSLGDTIWTRAFDPGYSTEARSVQQTTDGGYIIAGSTKDTISGDYDVYLVKTDENGLTGIQEERLTHSARRSTYTLEQNKPNPFCKLTSISYSLPTATDVTLSIYDITGRLVETLVNETQQPGVHRFNWDRTTNPSGVYFYQLSAGEFVETRKMVVVE